ncbi:unnamed protein product [Phytophthora fragariaefolia]|uniref:Unnamed protein product n=1 Tax=Phytophthora fragariaefolia TaxID=1490495 RepID=A0A9W7D5Z0_9STRA|nr:unnamed protein product [Phytophthora fragariaefolia]
MASQTEVGATAVTNNRATEAVNVTPVDSTAMENELRGEFSATSAFNDQQSSAQAVTHLTSPTVAGKRPRGRPRKRPPDIVAERDIDTAIGAEARASAAATVNTTATVGTPASAEIRTAADETTDIAATTEFTAPNERTPKRRRTQRTATALDDTIDGRSRSRIRREPYRSVDADDRAARDDSPSGARADEHTLVISKSSQLSEYPPVAEYIQKAVMMTERMNAWTRIYNIRQQLCKLMRKSAKPVGKRAHSSRSSSPQPRLKKMRHGPMYSSVKDDVVPAASLGPDHD